MLMSTKHHLAPAGALRIMGMPPPIWKMGFTGSVRMHKKESGILEQLSKIRLELAKLAAERASMLVDSLDRSTPSQSKDAQVDFKSASLADVFSFAGSTYSPPSPPETNSSETMSPIYPDRPIRPLPKKRLRDRLSLEAADTINYPPAPPSANPLFYPPYSDPGSPQNRANNGMADIDRVLIDAQSQYPSKEVPYEFHGADLTSEDENGRRREDSYSRTCGPSDYAAYRSSDRNSQSVGSSADSADGYESFENTNNKKKRKIPTSAGMHPALSNSLSTDLANMGISNPRGDPELDDGGVVHYYGSGNSAIPVSGTGIAGAGRGRYGRNGRRDGRQRSPLAASANASNAWQAVSYAQGKRGQQGLEAYAAPEIIPDSGIISQAIAEAAATPMALEQGQENMSLLDQRSARKSTPAAQFTFNLDSEAGARWPGDHYSQQAPQYHPAPPPPMPHSQLPPHQRGVNTQGTQTSPNMAGHQQQNGALPAQGQQPVPPPQKPRRPPAARYARAARQRRLDQEYQNYHHPPKDEDFWICEFCEYEAIFGHPPEALVRQYEIKDRRERKRLAEKRRLLEKAKSKGRKSRKGTKNANKNNSNNNNNNAANANANNANPAAPQNNGGQQNCAAQAPGAASYANDPNLPPGAAGDEYYSGDNDGGYEDDPDLDHDHDPPLHHMPAPPPQTPSKIPAPVAQQYGATARPPHGTGTFAGGGGLSPGSVF